MATAVEMMGISPMGLNGVPAVDPQQGATSAFAVGQLVMACCAATCARSEIITRAAFENAIAAVAATGGSTNAVLHLLAIAREAGVELSIDDFDAISARTPLIADLKPGGRFVATDLDAAGGMRLVAKRLLEAGILHGEPMTVTGRTLARRRDRREETPGQEVVRPHRQAAQAERRAGDPARATWRPTAAWSRSPATKRSLHTRPGARVRSAKRRASPPSAGADQGRATSSSSATRARRAARHARDARRHRRPRRRRAWATDVALLTDGRFSGATRGLMVGHVAPEAARGGPIAAVRDGDMIVFDVQPAAAHRSAARAEMAARMAAWKAAFKGKVGIVTGGGSGIGRAIAQDLPRRRRRADCGC